MSYFSRFNDHEESTPEPVEAKPEVIVHETSRTAGCCRGPHQREFQRTQASREPEAGSGTDSFQPASPSLPKSQARPVFSQHAHGPQAGRCHATAELVRPTGRDLLQTERGLRQTGRALPQRRGGPPVVPSRPMARIPTGMATPQTGLRPEIGPGNHPWPPGTSATALRWLAARRRRDGPAV